MKLLWRIGPPTAKGCFGQHAVHCFFESFRIVEILSSSKKSFDPSSCLLWGDVKFRQNSILIHVKMPKVKGKQGDYGDLFKFEETNCCPVRALWGLKKYGVFNNSSNLPVFAFASGNLLTPTELLDLCYHLTWASPLPSILVILSGQLSLPL